MDASSMNGATACQQCQKPDGIFHLHRPGGSLRLCALCKQVIVTRRSRIFGPPRGEARH